MKDGKIPAIDSFDFRPGRMLAGNYKVVSRLGAGWEGEVYFTRERLTDIERAVKVFYPQRNRRNRVAKLSARKLHKLRNCEILMRYVSQETISFQKQPITMLVSEFIDGALLKDYIKSRRGQRLPVFEALHLLHTLAKGIEEVHRNKEYHGDLHSENIIVRKSGLGFEVKLVDLYHRSAPKNESIQEDVCDMIRLFYDALGGRKHYAKHSKEIKAICCGLKRSLILKKYKTAGQLREYLENIQWHS